MGCLSKGLVVVLILTMTISCLTIMVVKPARAQIPTPTVPQFTVSVVGNSSVTVSIKNQPFTPYFDANLGDTVLLFYNVRVENHSEPDDWCTLYDPNSDYPTMSNSDYTNISIGVGSPYSGFPETGIFIPLGTKTDIQVEALIGVVHRQTEYYANGNEGLPSWVFNGTESGWSNTQTITMSEATSPTSSVPELSSLVIVPLLLSVFSFVVIIWHRKNR